MPEALQTDRLLLRPFTLDDAPEFWPLVSDPAVLRYTGEEPQTLEGARRILRERPLRDYAVHGFGRMACVERDSGRLVGFSGLKYLEDLHEVDIGYRFLPACWGKGYATETARALIAHGAQRQGIARVIGLVHPGNTASVNVLLKLGLVFERKVRLDDFRFALDLYAQAGTSPNDSFRPDALRAPE